MKTIYAITNTANGRQYVGQTSLNLKVRWGVHRSELRNGKHRNELLAVDWRLYGENAFKCEALEFVEKELADLAEKEWSLKLQAYYSLEKIDRKKLLPSVLSKEDTEQLKSIAKSLGYEYAGEGSIHELIRAIIDGDIELYKNKGSCA